MAVREQVLDSLTGAADVVEQHDVDVDLAGRTVDEDGAGAEPELRLEVAVIAAGGGRAARAGALAPCPRRERRPSSSA